MSDLKLAENLALVPIFSTFDKELLEQIAAAGSITTFHPEDIIFREGEEGDTLYVILEGYVKVAKIDPATRHETILNRLKRGDFFGEMSLFDSEPRSASIIALDDTVVLMISKEQFFQLVSENSDVAISMITFLGKRLRRANLNFRELEYIMRDIQRMLDTIIKIAKQSKMLALNASIESARSGAAGKSFSVVAGEMRSLADKSQQAVIEISELITTIRDKVGQIGD